MTRIFAITAVAAIVLLSVAIWLVTMGRTGDDAFAQCRSSTVAGGAAEIGGPFTLVDEGGQTVTDTDVIDKPTLVYFGYTYCPDICPYDAARNAEAVTLLENDGYMVKPVFITVDPERDTPEQLADFTSYIHPRMVGLTGSPEQIKAASTAYRTYYRKQDAEDDYYLVDHSTFTYLVLPEEGFVEFFRRDATPEQMAEATACFIDAR
ncbi:SCO family protein [Pseudooceanicola onchidii]|uniref:SCO family protein n=1 Tax=Pseudooceanicola onchidii TaxID=2562279 RepID=UPI0010A9A939|nr:SCO family protein [Pseudooceanicola onchidii]